MRNNLLRCPCVIFFALTLGMELLPLQAQDDAVAACHNGLDAAKRGDLDGAIADYSQAIALDPKYAGAYCVRGMAKGQKGDLDGAITDFSHAIDINPEYAAAYNGRGITKAQKGDLAGAIADFSQAIEINPQDAKSYSDRGHAKGEKGNIDGSIADFSKAIELNPQFAGAYYDRGVAKTDKGDFDGAIADYNKAIELDPQYADAYGGRGNAKLKKGDYDGAVADFSQAIVINPQDAGSYSNRGLMKASKGDYDGAIADFNQAIALDPQDADGYYFNRGTAKNEKGDHEGALSDYNKAISLRRAHEDNSSSAPPSVQPDTEKGVSLGTGFFVTSSGYLLTDFHVVKGASTIMVKIGNGIVPASLVAKDTVNDIALLKIDGTHACLPLGDSSSTMLGQTVFTVGFPEPELQGLSPKFTKGDVSSLAGVQDDPRMFQVSVPLQPGNSGGCLVDESGNVVGLIEGTMSTVETAKQSGDLLQNVNYATKINYAKTLLDTVPDAKSGLMPMKTAPAPFTGQVKSVEDATVFIIAGS